MASNQIQNLTQLDNGEALLDIEDVINVKPGSGSKLWLTTI